MRIFSSRVGLPWSVTDVCENANDAIPQAAVETGKSWLTNTSDGCRNGPPSPRDEPGSVSWLSLKPHRSTQRDGAVSYIRARVVEITHDHAWARGAVARRLRHKP